MYCLFFAPLCPGSQVQILALPRKGRYSALPWKLGPGLGLKFAPESRFVAPIRPGSPGFPPRPKYALPILSPVWRPCGYNMSSIMLQRKISFIINLLLYLIMDSQRKERKLIKDFTYKQKSAFIVQPSVGPVKRI